MGSRLFRASSSFAASPFASEKSVRGVVIGNFDGFHLGHQKLISELSSGLKELKADGNAFSGLLSFHPHPKIFFEKSKLLKEPRELPPDLLPLFGVREKVNFSNRYGLDFLVLEKFNSDLQNLSAEDFVLKILFKNLKVNLVVVGEDFCFGKKREGTVQDLANFSNKFNFKLKVVKAFNLNSERVSTGRVKKELKSGRVSDARDLLGRDYHIFGRVENGTQRGTNLTGFPTLNISQKAIFKPKSGVYLTEVQIGKSSFPSITNIGFRPTLCGKNLVIETFVLNKKLENLKGERIKLNFLSFVRDEKKFNGAEELSAAISKDVEYAKIFFKKKESRKLEFLADDYQDESNNRLDLLITNFLDNHQGLELGLSRNKISQLIKHGNVLVNEKEVLKPSFKTSEFSKINILVPVCGKSIIVPDSSIKLDAVYEDEDILVLNKQAGLVVHPGSGQEDGTLVNALVARISGDFNSVGSTLRPGIVHRLDKGTSGLMVVAKNQKSYLDLQKQFLPERTIKRKYTAVVGKIPDNWLGSKQGRIDLDIGRDPGNRKKFKVIEGGKPSITNWSLKEVLKRAFLLEIKLETGRTHQIRVHLSHCGAAILGDALYGENINSYQREIQSALNKITRQALHASFLEFIHPVTKNKISFSSDLPEDILELVSKL